MPQRHGRWLGNSYGFRWESEYAYRACVVWGLDLIAHRIIPFIMSFRSGSIPQRSHWNVHEDLDCSFCIRGQNPFRFPAILHAIHMRSKTPKIMGIVINQKLFHTCEINHIKRFLHSIPTSILNTLKIYKLVPALFWWGKCSPVSPEFLSKLL